MLRPECVLSRLDRVIPKSRVAVPELKRRLVLLRIVLLQPKQFLDRVYSLLHDVFHFGLRYMGVLHLARGRWAPRTAFKRRLGPLRSQLLSSRTRSPLLD